MSARAVLRDAMTTFRRFLCDMAVGAVVVLTLAGMGYALYLALAKGV